MTAPGRLRIEVLGPLRVSGVDGLEVTPDGALQRRLLALLVLRRGHVVPSDVAVDVLWPGALPRDPLASLQNHVFRLRRGLPDGALESAAEGYRLDPASIEVDADRLLALLSAADTGDGSTRVELDSLIARWHGPAYPELEETDEGRAEAARLEELRVLARERRAELRLAAGELDGLVAELAALVHDEPLRERPCALLMTALAATGRHVEALRAYDDFRRRLSDELGIEPSAVLSAQHAALLSASPLGEWVPATRLPAPVNALLGRGALMSELVERAGAQRLVTLVGPGGVGKTRLLLELGRELGQSRPVVLCELAAARAETAVEVVAAALAIDARPGVALDERIVEVLRDTAVLLLFDNCEHVLDATAALVDRLLTNCPGVSVLATSRERLRVAGEHVCHVPTLLASEDTGAAVALFLERASAIAPAFTPDGRDLATIAEIIRRLDGLPLAIELAAARLHTHDLSEIAAALDERFTLLSTGSRTSTRHASLSAAVSWSYELLDEPLRAFFTDLSVFSGPFDASAAAAVCAIDERAASVALAELVERSLVMRAPERRYLMLETLRAFGTERLVEARRIDVVAERHARHQVAWLGEANRRLLEPGSGALAAMDAAVVELRVALDWFLERNDTSGAGELVGQLFDYGFLRLRPDVFGWGERVIAADPDDRSPSAGLVWAVAAYASWMAGDIAASGVRSGRAFDVAERSGEVSPYIWSAVASQALFEGRLEEAARGYHRAVEAAVRTGQEAQVWLAGASELLALGYARDPTARARTEALLAELGDRETPYAAYAWYCAGEVELAIDEERARERFNRALQLADLTHASFVVGLTGASKASIDARSGDPRAAAAEYRWLIPHWQRAGMWSSQWTMLRSIALLLARLERFHDAAVLEGAVWATASGHRIFGADEVALGELALTLRSALGEDGFAAARAEGTRLGGDEAAEHALRALRPS